MKEALYTPGQTVTHLSHQDIPLKVVRYVTVNEEKWVQCCWMYHDELKREAFPEEMLIAAPEKGPGLLDPINLLNGD